METTTLRKTDIHKILLIIRSNYENAYNFKSSEEASLLIDFWYNALKVYPREAVIQATYSAIRNCDYAPRISNIIREVKVLLNSGKPTQEELWAQLTGVLHKVSETAAYLKYSQYNRWAVMRLEEIYNALSDELKLYLVNVSQLIEVAQMDTEALKYEKYHFFKAIPRLLEHAEDKAKAEQFMRLCEGDLRLFIGEGNGKKNNSN